MTGPFCSTVNETISDLDPEVKLILLPEFMVS